MPDIRWSVHLPVEPTVVFAMLATEQGRATFWASTAPEQDGVIIFRFGNGQTLRSRILDCRPPEHYALEYFGGSTVTFALAADGRGGTDLTVEESGLSNEGWRQNAPGWAAVLLHLKAAVLGVDLRNHDADRTWDRGYVDM